MNDYQALDTILQYKINILNLRNKSNNCSTPYVPNFLQMVNFLILKRRFTTFWKECFNTLKWFSG